MIDDISSDKVIYQDKYQVIIEVQLSWLERSPDKTEVDGSIPSTSTT